MTAFRNKQTKTYSYHFQIEGRRYTARGYATRRKALDAEAARRNQILVGLSGSWPTFSEMAKEYLAELKKRASKPWVSQCFWKLQKHADPIMGRPPREVKALHVQRLLADIGKKSPRTANEMHKILHAVFQWAVDMDAMERNPVHKVRKLSVIPREQPVITTEHLRAVIVASPPWLKAMLLTQAVVGARWTEIAALAPTDLELDAVPPYILLRSRKTGGRGEKTRKAFIVPAVVDALQVQIIAGASPHRLFPGRWKAKPISHAACRVALRDACERAEVPLYGWHAVRRWAGSEAMESGVSNTVVARFLGHSKTAITDLYMKVGDPTMMAVGEALAKRISG